MTADWVAAVAIRWQRAPVRLTSPTPIPRQQAFEVLRAACAPFRAGTRFRALPDVRFRTTEGQLRAPADLLPADDGDLRRYQDRLGSGYQLVVEQPLLLDFPLWSAVRDEISPLWRQVGWPVLPVVVELVVADDHTDVEAMTRAPTHASLLWVLAGEVQVRLLPPGTDPTLDPSGAETLAGKEGDLLYWPAGHRPLIEYGSRAAVLSLRIAQDPRLAVAAVHDVLGTLAAPQAGYDGTVPYLEFPPPPEIAPPLAAVGTAVRDVLAGPRIEVVLRQQWVKCRSAAGLLPPPAPRPQPALTPDDRVLIGELVTMPVGRERWLCGVNGHSFELGGAAGRRLLDALRPGRLTTIAELCAEVGARDEPGRRAVLALADKLHGLRGLVVADEAEVAQRCP